MSSGTFFNPWFAIAQGMAQGALESRAQQTLQAHLTPPPPPAPPIPPPEPTHGELRRVEVHNQ